MGFGGAESHRMAAWRDRYRVSYKHYWSKHLAQGANIRQAGIHSHYITLAYHRACHPCLSRCPQQPNAPRPVAVPAYSGGSRDHTTDSPSIATTLVIAEILETALCGRLKTDGDSRSSCFGLGGPKLSFSPPFCHRRRSDSTRHHSNYSNALERAGRVNSANSTTILTAQEANGTRVRGP